MYFTRENSKEIIGFEIGNNMGHEFWFGNKMILQKQLNNVRIPCYSMIYIWILILTGMLSSFIRIINTLLYDMNEWY